MQSLIKFELTFPSKSINIKSALSCAFLCNNKNNKEKLMASPNTKRNLNADSKDLYITPKEALQEMQKCLTPNEVLYDPCAGLGDMTEYFANSGYECYSGDLYDYGYSNMDFCEDFLEQKELPHLSITTIVMNPPYTLTAEFVDRSLELVDKVVVFNRLTMLESKKRSTKFKSGEWPLKEVKVFGYRVSCAKGVNREKSPNSVPYAIYTFDKNYTEKPIIDWII